MVRAAGQGQGRRLVVCPPPSVFSVSYAARTLGVAVDPSGAPFSLYPGTPFYVVCVFRGLALVALSFPTARPLCVGACALEWPSLLLSCSCPPPRRLFSLRAPCEVSAKNVPCGSCPSAFLIQVLAPLFLWGGRGCWRFGARFRPPRWLVIQTPGRLHPSAEAFGHRRRGF